MSFHSSRFPASSSSAAAAASTTAAGRPLSSSARLPSTSTSTNTQQQGLHIRVCIRLRPENSQEMNSSKVVEIIDNQSLVFDPWHMTKGARTQLRRAKNMLFGFDRVFGPTATQDEVYAESTEGVVDSVLDGYNATVFAYGATGSGKTHTMMGNDRVGPGVMGLAMRELWRKIDMAQDEFDFDVSVSCLEVYNETLHDLFVETSAALEMWDDPRGHCVVSKLSVQHPHSVDEVQRMLMEANKRRRQSPTDANQESSRSHAVFMVTVTKRPKASGLTETVLEGKLNLIDLAGSERASKTNNRSERLREGANINKSLLALASCINALGQNYHQGQHIPFRNSKLTRLLKDSLGGKCRTTMIAAISPSSLSYEDTYQTLNYASRTRNIKINATRKAIPIRANLGQYRDKIETLNAEVTKLRALLKDQQTKQGCCSCIKSQPDNIQDIVRRAQQLFNTRTALFNQLIGADARISTLICRGDVSSTSMTDLEEDKMELKNRNTQLLREAREQKGKILSQLTYNETGLNLVLQEIDRLPDQVKEIVLHEVHALSYDSQIAHGSYCERFKTAAMNLLSDLSVTDVIPVDHPLAARIRAFLLEYSKTSSTMQQTGGISGPSSTVVHGEASRDSHDSPVSAVNLKRSAADANLPSSSVPRSMPRLNRGDSVISSSNDDGSSASTVGRGFMRPNGAFLKPTIMIAPSLGVDDGDDVLLRSNTSYPSRPISSMDAAAYMPIQVENSQRQIRSILKNASSQRNTESSRNVKFSDDVATKDVSTEQSTSRSATLSTSAAGSTLTSSLAASNPMVVFSEISRRSNALQSRVPPFRRQPGATTASRFTGTLSSSSIRSSSTSSNPTTATIPTTQQQQQQQP